MLVWIGVTVVLSKELKAPRRLGDVAIFLFNLLLKVVSLQSNKRVGPAVSGALPLVYGIIVPYSTILV